MSRNISYALIGWFAGIVTVVVLGLVWPLVFPGIVNIDHYYGAGPSLPMIIVIASLVISPASLVGGFIGGRVTIEGGEMTQRGIAAIFGIFFAIPFACVVLMYFTGWGFSIS